MKIVSLISSGIDSPVATYLISKKIDEIILLHADIRPYTDEKEIDNFILIAKHLKKITSKKMKAYLLPHGQALTIFKKKCENRLTCIFCKRMLVRYAEKIAIKENAEAIVVGDSLGQVASQTIQNIAAIEDTVDIPILRPLIGFDKEEIIEIAKDIGAYELSIRQSLACSAVPNKPSTRAKIEKLIENEKLIELEKLTEEIIDKMKLISI
jgi:thiamine biosynthesis protein ThiI